MIGRVQQPSQVLIAELARRGQSQPRRVPPPGIGLPKRLQAPDMRSVRVVRERRTGDRCGVAVTVSDATGERYRVVRELQREAGVWRLGGGFEGPDRVLPGKPDPYVSLGALFSGLSFFASGVVQSSRFEVARVRVVWDDGQVLEDAVEKGVVFFFGSRESLDAARAECFDSEGLLIGTHEILIDERTPPAVRSTQATADPPAVTWRELNDLTHLAVVAEEIAGLLYAVPSPSAAHGRWDLCWRSSENPDETYVLFGTSEEHEDAWATRWDRAHQMVDSFLREAADHSDCAST